MGGWGQKLPHINCQVSQSIELLSASPKRMLSWMCSLKISHFVSIFTGWFTCPQGSSFSDFQYQYLYTLTCPLSHIYPYLGMFLFPYKMDGQTIVLTLRGKISLITSFKATLQWGCSTAAVHFWLAITCQTDSLCTILSFISLLSFVHRCEQMERHWWRVTGCIGIWTVWHSLHGALWPYWC
jgi:hypothetical protein